jgi:preprotein translocase subunit SecE
MFEKINLYLKESYNELVQNVTWPSWQNLQESTIVVLVSTLVIAAIIFLMDAGSGSLLKLIYGLN